VWIAQSLFGRLPGRRQIILADCGAVSEYWRHSLAVVDVRLVLQKNVFSFVYGTQAHTPMAPLH
jgi:hypothetical protein